MKPVSSDMRNKIMIELVGGMSPEQKAITRGRAKSLLEAGSDTSPVQHWTQGLARVVQGGVGGFQQAQAANADREAATLQRQALMEALNGGSMEGAAATLMGNAGTADMGAQLAGSVLADRQASARAASDRTYQEGAMQRETQRRAQIAQQYGLQQGTPEFQRFVLTGQMPAAGGQQQTDDIQEFQFAQQNGFQGSFMDYMASKKSAGQQLSATDRKAILEADEMVDSNQSVINALDEAVRINAQAWYGPAAKTRAEYGSYVGLDGSEATLSLDNIVTSRALEGLKATFGAAPTEGERKILLEIAGSVNQTPEVRADIFRRARAAAERRLQFNRDRAAGLRGGTYYQQGPQSQAPQAGQTFVYDPETRQLRPE